jgi:hypothetical protein
MFGRHDRISPYILVLGDEVLEEAGIDLSIVPILLEVNTVDLLGFDTGRDVGGLYLQGCPLVLVIRDSLNYPYLEYAVFAALLLREDFKCFRRISRSDNTVGDLARDDTSSSDVARGRKSDEVTERGHAVSAYNATISYDLPGET